MRSLYLVVVVCMAVLPALSQNLTTPKIVFGTEYFKHEEPVSSVAVSPDGKYFISGAEKNLIFWDSREGKKVKTLHKAVSGIVAMAVSPDGARIIFEDSC